MSGTLCLAPAVWARACRRGCKGVTEQGLLVKRWVFSRKAMQVEPGFSKFERSSKTSKAQVWVPPENVKVWVQFG